MDEINTPLECFWTFSYFEDILGILQAIWVTSSSNNDFREGPACHSQQISFSKILANHLNKGEENYDSYKNEEIMPFWLGQKSMK